MPVLLRGAAAGDLLTQHQPQLAGGCRLLVDQRAVAPGGALLAVGDPAARRQRAEVAAGGRLRQLQHLAELRDRQLLALEDQQQPAAERFVELRQIVEQGSGRHISVHPDERIHWRGRGVKPAFLARRARTAGRPARGASSGAATVPETGPGKAVARRTRGRQRRPGDVGAARQRR